MNDETYLEAGINTLVDQLEMDGRLVKGTYNHITIEVISGKPMMTFFNGDECIYILDIQAYRDSL